MEFGNGDGSRVMLLAEETTESEELVRRKETNSTNSFDGDDGQHLNAIEVQIFSAGDKTNVLLDEINESVCSGEPSKEHAVKMGAEQMARSSRNVTPETEDGGKESNGDESHDDDFSANDLLRFAWQIAQGMVNNVRQLPFRACR